MNPLLAMPQVSGKIPRGDVATFSPTLLSNYTSTIEKMKALENTVHDDKLLKNIATFRSAVKVGNVPLAVSAITHIYPHKIFLVKTFLETAIDYVSVRKIGVTNNVFDLTDINKEAMDVFPAPV